MLVRHRETLSQKQQQQQQKEWVRQREPGHKGGNMRAHERGERERERERTTVHVRGHNVWGQRTATWSQLSPSSVWECVGFKNQTQVDTLGSKPLYLLVNLLTPVFLIFTVLEMEPRAFPCILGKSSTTELCPQTKDILLHDYRTRTTVKKLPLTQYYITFSP